MARQLIIALLFSVLALPASAQRGGFGGGGLHGGFPVGGGFANRAARFGRGATFWGDPFFYADYPYQSLAYPAPVPPVVIIQEKDDQPSQPAHESHALMIEWQGDRYVRSDGQEQRGSEPGSVGRASSNSVERGSATPAHPDLPPAVLIYRDGHREQVSDYVIESGKLYAHGNYWVDGYWNKTVQLAALNIPATLKANLQSGVQFVLPSGPNEVVTRP
jgi:hypothetical protein